MTKIDASNDDYCSMIRGTRVPAIFTEQFWVGEDGYLSEKVDVAISRPVVVKEFLCPLNDDVRGNVLRTRSNIRSCLNDEAGSKKTVIVGPKSLNDPFQSKACSLWLSHLANKVIPEDVSQYPADIRDKMFRDDYSIDELNIVMNLNVNFMVKHSEEQGVFINHISSQGICSTRSFLLSLAEDIPLSGEINDVLSSQYLNDIFSIGLVNGYNIESRLHRNLVSGCSFAVGFQVRADLIEQTITHEFGKAKDAIETSRSPHIFLGIGNEGDVSAIETTGNEDTFAVIPICLSDSSLIDYNTLQNLIRGIKYKVFLDFGQISNKNLKGSIELVRSVLQNKDMETLTKGFLIDSGDVYVAQRKEPYSDEYSIGRNVYSAISEQINSKSPSQLKHRFLDAWRSSFDMMKSLNFVGGNSQENLQFELFSNASILLEEINSVLKK